MRIKTKLMSTEEILEQIIEDKGKKYEIKDEAEVFLKPISEVKVTCYDEDIVAAYKMDPVDGQGEPIYVLPLKLKVPDPSRDFCVFLYFVGLALAVYGFVTFVELLSNLS